MKQVMPAAMPPGHVVSACHSTDLGQMRLDRWELLSLVTELRRPLGLNDRDIMVLRAHLSVLPHGTLNPVGLNVSFMNLSEIQERACGMDERRFRRAEVRLEESGLVVRRLSANGRRFPERDAEGKIVNAYGIDLSPLLHRHGELRALRDEINARALEMRQRRNALSARISALLRLYRDIPETLLDLRDALRNALRRKATCETEIEALERTLAEAEADAPCPHQVHEAIIEPVKKAADAGQTVRHIDPKPKEIKHNEDHIDKIQNAWMNTKTIKEFHPSPPMSLRQVYYSLTEFAGYLAVKRPTLEAFLMHHGAKETIRVLDHMASHLNQIDRPDCYLASMLRCWRSGMRDKGSVKLLNLPR